MVTAMVSTLTGIPVRADVAMTGGHAAGRVLAIGGLKEKLLAALRGGIKTCDLIPEENRKDLAEIPANIREGWTSSRFPMSTNSGPCARRPGRAHRMDRGRRSGHPTRRADRAGRGSGCNCTLTVRGACPGFPCRHETRKAARTDLACGFA
jgi:hypothetical protein